MGIKNLAFCVADIAPESQSTSAPAAALQQPPLSMHISAWQRISLPLGAPAPDSQSSNADVDADVASPYAPPQLSTTAYTLVKSVLLPFNANAILVERQRFRSGGAAAVQEWTLRVNTLEAMVWAVLRALGFRDGVVPAVALAAVEPARVAAFWLPGRPAVDKAAKVALVRAWVGAAAAAAAEGAPLALAFAEPAAAARDAFLRPASSGRRSRVRAVAVGSDDEKVGVEAREDVGKLDDLADCLLQAAAWAKWKSNKELLKAIWDDEDKIKTFAERDMAV